MPKKGNPFIELPVRNLIALFGAHNLNDPYEIGRMSLSPEKIQVHDDWNPSLETFDADIAILTFEAGAIMFSTYVQPICLWNGDTPPSQTVGHLGGWGQSENLENIFEEIPTKLKVPIYTNEFCFLTTKDLVDIASNRTFCAGRGDGTGICTGDSGGGVSIRVGSSFYFRGIVSSGLYDELGCDVLKFAVFTDVLKFNPWIDQILSGDGETLTSEVVRAGLRCRIKSKSSFSNEHTNVTQTCYIEKQNIDGDGFFVDGDPNLSIQDFYVINNRKVKFLPEFIAESFPRLIAYRAYNCSIKIVNEKHFEGLNELEYLALHNNEIESIDRDSFKDLTKLKELDLHHNRIKTIDPNLFQNLGNLWRLRIDYNEIEFLNETTFDNLTNLRKIELENNKLSVNSTNLFKNNHKLEKTWFDVIEGADRSLVVAAWLFAVLFFTVVGFFVVAYWDEKQHRAKTRKNRIAYLAQCEQNPNNQINSV